MSNRTPWLHRRDAYATCIAALLCASPLAGAEPSAVVKIDGDAIHFATLEGEKAVAINDFVKWGALRDSSQGTQIVLADGSVIVASEVRIADEKLVVDTNLFGEVEESKLQGTLRLPLDAVRAVLLRVPIDPRERDGQLAKVWQAAGNADQLLLANGDVMTGTLKKLEPLPGEGETPGPLAAMLETSAGEVTIAPDRLEGRLSDKIAAIIFNPQLVRAADAASPQLVIGLADGSRLFATRVEANGERATFHTAAASIISHPDENIWTKITSLQSIGGKAKYLSALPTTGYKHLPLVGPAWPLGVDENVLGGKLRSGGRLALRGLGMHAASRVVIQLDRPYAKFEAELALDDSAGDQGSVSFIVLSDASGAFKPIYKSPVIRGGDATTPISIDIAGAKRIALFVEPADHGDVLDRANWLDARLLGERGASAP